MSTDLQDDRILSEDEYNDLQRIVNLLQPRAVAGFSKPKKWVRLQVEGHDFSYTVALGA